MAPSDDPADYSNVSPIYLVFTNAYNTQWCSFCNEFGGDLVLCAGCRTVVCMRIVGQPGGCISWTHRAEEEDFIFHCLFCTRDMGTPSQVDRFIW